MDKHDQFSLDFQQASPANPILANPILMGIPIVDGQISFSEHFYSSEESDLLFNQLLSEIDWKQDHINIYSKKIPLPRETAWYGDPDKHYFYSGILNIALPWTDILIKIRDKVHEATGHEFNSVLLNRYRSGNDYVSWHQDNEPELGKNPVIASLSLGEVRKFQLRHKKRKDIEMIQILLTDGSLLLMSGTTQTFWKHQLPRTTRPVGERLNLTFRKII